MPFFNSAKHRRAGSTHNKGKIRHAGYSGDNDTAAYAAALPDVAVIETSISIADQANVEAVLQGAEHNVGVIAKRPIANAAWKDPEYRSPTDSEWEEFLGHFERRRVALGDCGRAYGSSPGLSRSLAAEWRA